MKFSQGIFVLASAVGGGGGTVMAQTTYACPALPEGSPTVITDTSSPARLSTVSNPDGLCTLVRRNINPPHRRAPVARSYANRPWETTAGLFANTQQSGLDIDCTSSGTGECDVTLPPLNAGEEYILESYVHSSPSSDATAARFLEQSTFGATREDIDALVATGLDFESWLHDQMNMPVSSLREFYRRRVNPKFENAHYVGAVGAGPCDIYSRWRKYAVSSAFSTM